MLTDAQILVRDTARQFALARLVPHSRAQEAAGAISSDVIEMRVERPPSTREAAFAVAEEQFAYCSDIVLQGTGSISALAATLMNGTAWYFWWD